MAALAVGARAILTRLAAVRAAVVLGVGVEEEVAAGPRTHLLL
eukprot:SAG22_NODE_7207_length_762_cov_0.692308_2_plen_42_part_01